MAPRLVSSTNMLEEAEHIFAAAVEQASNAHMAEDADLVDSVDPGDSLGAVPPRELELGPEATGVTTNAAVTGVVGRESSAGKPMPP
jgi:hypothetical protein